jgi:ribosomal protein S2
LNIPCSTLIDSNIGFYGIFYGIPANDDNFVTIYLFTRLFIKIYLKSIYDNINNLKILYKNKKKNKIKEFFLKNLKFKKKKYKKKKLFNNKNKKNN